MSSATTAPQIADVKKELNLDGALDSLKVKASGWFSPSEWRAYIDNRAHDSYSKVTNYLNALGNISNVLGTPTAINPTATGGLLKATEDLQQACNTGIKARLDARVVAAQGIVERALGGNGVTFDEFKALSPKQQTALVKTLPEGDRKAIVNAVTELKRAIADSKNVIAATGQSVTKLFKHFSDSQMPEALQQKTVELFTKYITPLLSRSKSAQSFDSAIKAAADRTLKEIDTDHKVSKAPELVKHIDATLSQLTGGGLGEVQIDKNLGLGMKRFIDSKVSALKHELDVEVNTPNQNKLRIAELYVQVEQAFKSALEVVNAAEESLRPLSKVKEPLTGRAAYPQDGDLYKIAVAYHHGGLANPILERAGGYLGVANAKVMDLLKDPSITAAEIKQALEPLSGKREEFFNKAKSQIGSLSGLADSNRADFYQKIAANTGTDAAQLGQQIDDVITKILKARTAAPPPPPTGGPTPF